MKMPKYAHIYNPKKILLGKVIDFITWSFVKKPKNLNLQGYSKILLIQSHLIGDLIILTSLVNNLKKAHPDLQIDILANKFATTLLANNPQINTIHTTRFPWSNYDYSLKCIFMYLKDLRKLPHYDIVIDAQIDILNVLSMLFVNSKERIAIPVTGGKAFLTSFYIPEDQKTHNMLTMRNEIMHIFSKRSENTSDVFLYPDADDKKVIDDFLAAKEIENFIVIHPGASLAIKRWPAKYIVNLVDKLHQKGHKIVLTGGPNDKDLIDEIQGLSEVSPSIFLGSLLQATQLISKAKFLVCMDSAASHLANAVKTKAFILYNSYNDPEVIKPPATFLHAITAKTGKEINSITPEEVLAYIERSSS